MDDNTVFGGFRVDRDGVQIAHKRAGVSVMMKATKRAATSQRCPGFTTSKPRAFAPAASAMSVVMRRRRPSSSMAAR